MIFRPSSVSVSISVASPAVRAGAVTAGGSSRIGSTTAAFSRMREIGGRIVRLTDSSLGTRFGLGACGSINETLSTGGLDGGSGAAGTGLGGVFFAVIGAKADLVVVTGGFGRSVRSLVAARPSSEVTATFSASVAFVFVAVLTPLRERVDDDLAAAADFAVLRAGALGALDLVVVFVAI